MRNIYFSGFDALVSNVYYFCIDFVCRFGFGCIRATRQCQRCIRTSRPLLLGATFHYLIYTKYMHCMIVCVCACLFFIWFLIFILSFCRWCVASHETIVSPFARTPAARRGRTPPLHSCQSNLRWDIKYLDMCVYLYSLNSLCCRVGAWSIYVLAPYYLLVVVYSRLFVLIM